MMTRTQVDNINGYLYNRDDVYVDPRDTPLSRVLPTMGRGVESLNSGNHVITDTPTPVFLYGTLEMVTRKPRYVKGGRDRTYPDHLITVGDIMVENRRHMTADVLPGNTVLAGANAIVNGPMWCLAILLSRLAMVWTSYTCTKFCDSPRFKVRTSWNTLPITK